jgi:8-oxo-dGTP pyrophosphatase MutT (NUDIX family)
MKQSARAIVLKDGNLLLMKRFKLDREYYTLLGGTIKPMEQPAAAALREVLEESGVVVNNPRLVFEEDAGDPFGPQHIFMCDYVSGDPKLPAESEEAFWTTPGKNTYEPLWFPFDSLQDIPFVSPLLKEALLIARDKGFPSEPYHFSTRHATRLS